MNEKLVQRLHTLIIRSEVIQEEQVEINKELRELIADIKLEKASGGTSE